MPVITLTTDFGLNDPYVGIMKGVILSICPNARIVDLCHLLPPQDIIAGALTLEASVTYFPDGAVHCAVVDPGVGGSRAAVAVDCGSFYLVGPDNGLFSLVIERHSSMQAVNLTNSAYQLPQVSSTFHGRDIFAPAAAHLAAGALISDLGDPAGPLQRIEIPAPIVEDSSIILSVLHVDRFGNLITNLVQDRLPVLAPGRDAAAMTVEAGSVLIHGISSTYSDVEEGRTVAYFGSSGRLEVAVRNGSASQQLGLVRGAELRLHLPTDGS